MRAPAPVEITSLQNSWVKDVRRAVRKGTLTDSGLLVAEGVHLYEEALRSGLRIEALFAAPSHAPAYPAATRVAPAVMREMTSLDHPAGLIALVDAPTDAELTFAPGDRVLVLDALQDPGNAGALLRSAEAFGVRAVVALKGTVDLFSPKVLRASTGSAFRVPIRRHVAWHDLNVPPALPIFAAATRGGQDPTGTDWSAGAIIVVGNEGQGLSPALAQITNPVTIPTRGVESLNAAVAASILLYEAARGAKQ